MAWIETVSPEDADGSLAEVYREASDRAGKVFQILQLQSLRPAALRSSTDLYLGVMRSDDSGLTRAQREMIATTVSQLNHCHY